MERFLEIFITIWHISVTIAILMILIGMKTFIKQYNRDMHIMERYIDLMNKSTYEHALNVYNRLCGKPDLDDDEKALLEKAKTMVNAFEANNKKAR